LWAPSVSSNHGGQSPSGRVLLDLGQRRVQVGPLAVSAGRPTGSSSSSGSREKPSESKPLSAGRSPVLPSCRRRLLDACRKRSAFTAGSCESLSTACGDRLALPADVCSTASANCLSWVTTDPSSGGTARPVRCGLRSGEQAVLGQIVANPGSWNGDGHSSGVNLPQVASRGAPSAMSSAGTFGA